MINLVLSMILVLSIISCSSSDSKSPSTTQPPAGNHVPDTSKAVSIKYTSNDEFSIKNEKYNYKFQRVSWHKSDKPDIKHHVFKVYNQGSKKLEFQIYIESENYQIVNVKRNSGIPLDILEEVNSSNKSLKSHGSLELDINDFYQSRKIFSFQYLNSCRNNDIWKKLVNTRLDLIEFIPVQLSTNKGLDPLFSHRSNGFNTAIIFDGKSKKFKDFIFIKQDGKTIDEGDWKFIAKYNPVDLYEDVWPYNSPKDITPTSVYRGICHLLYEGLNPKLQDSDNKFVFAYDEELESGDKFRAAMETNKDFIEFSLDFNKIKSARYPISHLQKNKSVSERIRQIDTNDPLWKLIQEGREL